MSVKTMSLNFEDLASIPKLELSERIPPETAVQMTLKSSLPGGVPNCDAYRSWATLLFQHYGPSKISESDLNELLQMFSLSVEELIKACENDESNSKLKDLHEFLSYTSELFTWIGSASIELTFREKTAFLCFGLTVVDNFLAVMLNRKHFRRFLEMSLAVQKLILHILSSFRPEQPFSDKSSLSNLVSHLCSIGEKTPKLDIKTAVDTWKATIKLLSQNAAHSEAADNTWLTRPMEFLIQEIGRNVQTVFKEDSLNEPIQQIEKYLKVTNFYLRLLQKVSTDFRHLPFPACKDFVDNLIVIYIPPRSIVGSPVEKLVVEYVSKGFKELTQFAYKNPQFFEELLRKQSDNFEENECLHVILLDALELAIRRSEIKFLDSQLFWKIFEKSLSSSYIFLSTPQYNRFVEVFAALQISFRPEHFERELLQSVLQDDIALATAAIDVWCIVFRNSLPSERCSYFTFWRDINEQFSKFSNQLLSLYVEVLLRNFYSMLSAEEREKLWLEFDPRMLTHDRFLLAIGLESIPNDTQRTNVIQHHAKKLKRFLKECPRDMTLDNFYSIIKDVKLLTPIAFNNDELNEILLQYLEISMGHKKFDMLTENILDFVASKLEFIKDSRVLKILTDLSTQLSHFEDYQMKLCLVRFLTKVATNSRFKELAEKILKIFEKDELINHFGCTEKSLRSQRTYKEPNVALLRDIMKKRVLDAVEDTHVCAEDEDIPAKRVKKDVDEVIEALENTVNKLHSFARREPLDSSRMRILKQIVSKLETIDGLS